MIRWPLYPAEALACLVALLFTWRAFRSRARGWQEYPVIVPWLLAKFVYAQWLTILVWRAGWVDLTPSHAVAFWANLLMLAGPLSVAGLMALRWKRG